MLIERQKQISFLEKRGGFSFAKGGSVYDKSLYGEHREHEHDVIQRLGKNILS